MTFAAIFAIIVGVGMIIQWVMSCATRQIPELTTEPIRIGFHIAGEMATALVLIAGGAGLVSRRPWGPAVLLVSLGMLLYTVIVSPGYFAQRGRWTWVLIFAAVMLLAVASMIVVAGGVGAWNR
jgi:hypothetical protein